MILKEIKNIFQAELKGIYAPEETDVLFFRLTEAYFGINRIGLALQPELVLRKEEDDRLFAALHELKQHRPVQQILGSTLFYGLELKVNEHVLIPRPETEELVDWICSDYGHKSGLSVLDIGTGSGCIAIALARNLPGARVTAVDLSEAALETARENAGMHGADIRFIREDILKAHKLPEENIDIIVSNPPYVRNMEAREIKKNVLKHEPHKALFVPDDTPLVFYEKIARLASGHLAKGGSLYFEINQYLGKEMIKMIGDTGFKNSILKKDASGNDRMLKAFC
ncbi:peptide chain release factor N(5)-glutamine methyltransferase [Sinomicrobium soli]|nr:peptide chain release factor N(5)-glutamine methyltransferase [Sinomicrobium sp. N-1-3-6]